MTSSADRIAAAGIEVTPVEELARLSVRCRLEYAGVLAAATGLLLPAAPLTAARIGSKSALHLGPDEWLLLDSAVGFDFAAITRAASSSAAPAVSMVDVSDRHRALCIEGDRSAELIAAGCPLDLDARVFPVDSCTRTVLGRVQIILWRTRTATFHVETGRSYADYAWSFLRTAAFDL